MKLSDLEKQREDIVEKIEKEFKLIDFSGTTRNNIIKLIEEKT